MSTIGKFTLQFDKPAGYDKELRLLYKEKREAKKLYESSISNKDQTRINECLQHYVNLQQRVAKTREDKENEMITKKLNKIIEEGGNSKTFWNIKRSMTKNTLDDWYTIKDEGGKRLYNPEEIKECCANYFQNLLQTREGSTTIAQAWTKKIETDINSYWISSDYENLKLNSPITPEDITTAIKQLKPNKAAGPDNIKNEFLTQAKEEILPSLQQIMSLIYKTEQIPEQWQESEITTIYKGKGDRELLTNTRGLTLSSAVGKLFERIINNRICPQLDYTEAQAGGRKGRSTTDHLFILKSILNQAKMDGKPVYCAFLDLEKAYDKVWIMGIMHILWGSGIKGKLWRLVYKLNSNIKAQIRTKYGLTRIIKIPENLKQGGVLSVAEFAKIIDELEREMKDHGLGYAYHDLLISTLLFVDDIVLMAETPEILQKMLDVVENFTVKWRLVIGMKKSKVMVIGPTAKLNTKWKIGDDELEVVKTYNYLGEAISNDLSMKYHFQQKAGKTEAMLQTVLAISKNEVLSKIQGGTLLKLYEACIAPSILYGCETWLDIEKYIPQLESLQHACIRRLFKLGSGTPLPALIGETGILPISIQADRRQFNYLHKLLTAKAERLNKQVLLEQNDYFMYNQSSWINQVTRRLQLYNIMTDLDGIGATSKKHWKKIVHNQTEAYYENDYDVASRRLSKLKQLCLNKNKPKRETYITQTQRKIASTILKLRTRMLPLKENMKNQYKHNTGCRYCKLAPENEYHIIEECPEFDELRLKHNRPQYEHCFTGTLNEIISLANFVQTIILSAPHQ